MDQPPQFLVLAVDSSEQLYVGFDTVINGGSGYLSTFAASANGNVAPIRTITVPNGAGGIALDSSGNIYTTTAASSGREIAVFANSASGTATPQKTIIPGSASMYFDSLGVDAVGIYVITGSTATSYNAIAAVPPTVSGLVSPVLTTTSSAWTNTLHFPIAIH